MASVTKDQLTFAYRDVATYDTPSLPNTALFNSDEEKIRIAIKTGVLWKNHSTPVFGLY